MRIIKQVFKTNWYIITATFLMLICSEVLKGIMKHNSFPDSFDLLEFSGTSLLNVAVLIIGVIVSFFLTGMFDNKLSGLISAIFTVYAVLFSHLIFGNEVAFYFFWFISIIVLQFYYTNACTDSVMHTVFYYIMITALAVVMSEEIEFFVILISAVILFAAVRGSVRQKSALVINYICCVIAIIALVCMFIVRMDDYFGIKIIEGNEHHLEYMYLDTKPFGEAEYYYNHNLEMKSLYNLAKVFRHFGYVAGAAMCVVITLFALSFFVKCFGNRNKPCSVSIFATVMISVRCIAGIFENFSIICGMRVRIPILSDDITGFLVTGMMLGFLLVSDEIVNGINNMLEKILRKAFKKYPIFEPEPEPDSEPDKPQLTLVVSKEHDDV